jgi:membrane-anchored protein YejM (alkaline phosphatase superfamily)
MQSIHVKLMVALPPSNTSYYYTENICFASVSFILFACLRMQMYVVHALSFILSSEAEAEDDAVHVTKVSMLYLLFRFTLHFNYNFHLNRFSFNSRTTIDSFLQPHAFAAVTVCTRGPAIAIP